jgi:hypothetical protein
MEGRRYRIRPGLEMLEGRDCPSVTAGVNGGNLIVEATTATSNLAITETASGSFQVSLNGQTLGSYSGVNGDLRLQLSNKNNMGALINLGGFNSIDNVFASLGNGTDGLTIDNGGIQGRLTITGGKGADQVTLGGDGNPLTVGGGAAISLGSSTADSVTLSSGVDIKGGLVATSVDNFNMQAGSRIGGNLAVSGGSGAWALLNGQVEHDAAFTGSRHDDNFTLGATGAIGRDLTIASRGGGDTIDIHGSVGRDLTIHSKGWGGNKDVQVDGKVGRDATIVLGSGNDSVDLNGSVQRNLYVATGAGADFVNVEGGVSARKLTIDLGGGDDTLMWNGGAHISGSATLRGGGSQTAVPGDTFVTNLNILPKNLHLYGFKTKHLGV